MALSGGTSLGTFEITELLGKGEMGEVYRTKPKAYEGNNFCLCHPQRHGKEDDGASIGKYYQSLRPRAEQPRGRAYTGKRIVLLVLQGIDRVIADHPEYAAQVENDRWLAEISQ